MISRILLPSQQLFTRFPDILTKWAILVTASAIAGAFFALYSSPVSIGKFVGIVAGIATLVLAYALLDQWLATHQLDLLRRRLVSAVYIKMALQPVPYIELVAGIIASSILEGIGIKSTESFLPIYLMTVLVALQLSAFVAVVMACWSVVAFAVKRFLHR